MTVLDLARAAVEARRNRNKVPISRRGPTLWDSEVKALNKYRLAATPEAWLDLERQLQEAREALEKIILSQNNVPGTLINNILDIAREALKSPR